MDVPEWAEEGQDPAEAFVFIRLFTAAEVFALGDDTIQNDARMYQAIVKTVCDENGEPILTADDVDALATKSRRTIERLFDEVASFNKMGKDDQQESAKNSETTPAEDSQ